MRADLHKRTDQSRGFSLLELMVAMATMLVISGAAFTMVIAYQKTFTSTALKADMHSGLRSATELLEQEIGQAGLLSSTPTTLTAAVTSSSTAQSASVGSTTNMFVGEILQVDTGPSQEAVTITAVGTASFSGIFKKDHGNGAVVAAAGVFPQGILNSSTATQLRMFGDINADGTPVYVRYDCDTTAGTLTRSITPITAGASNASVVLLDGLVANPGGTACFTYASTTVGSNTFVTTIGVTLTTQTTERDPQTGQFATETKSFLNVVPRNVLMGLTLANANLNDHLQPTPPGVPLP